MPVAAKSGLELRLDLFDLLPQPQRLTGKSLHDHRGGVLPGDDGVLGVGGVDGDLSDLLGLPGACLAELRGDAGHSGVAKLLGCLVLGEQGQRTLAAGVVERGFQGGEVFQQRGAETVDRAGAVSDEIGAVRGEHPQLDRDVVRRADRGQIPTHPGLVGDDRGVFRVGLPVAAVGGRGVMDRAAGDVEQGLPVRGEHRDQQRGPALIQIRRPDQLAGVGQSGHVRQQREDLVLGVGDLPRQQPGAVLVDHHAMMMGFAGIHSGPKSRHPRLRSLRCFHPSERPRRLVLTQRSDRISQSAVESLRDTGRPILSSRRNGTHMTAIPGTPGVVRSLRRPRNHHSTK